MEPYKVYVKIDDADRILAINSDAFLTDVTGWVLIDEGYGDRCHHAQGNYLPGPVANDLGIPRYKLENGYVVERTADEIAADYVEPERKPSTEERLSAMEEQLAAYEAAYLEGVEDA